MEESDRPSKRDAFLALLRAGWASLHLDARSPGVVVPAPFSSQAHLVLQYGRNMPIAITDLEVTEAGVSATLSFARVSRRTYIPWSAVYAVTCTNGCGMIYREDMPADVALATPTDVDDVAMMELQLKGRMRKKDPYALRSEGPWLRAVPAEEEIVAGELAIHLHSRHRRPQLRVIK